MNIFVRVRTYLEILNRKTVKALLDDMVAIKVLNQVNDMLLQGFNNRLDLLGVGKNLDHLLEGASAVLIKRNLNHLRSSAVD